MNIDAMLAGIDQLDYPRALLVDRYLASHLYRLESQFRVGPKADPQPKPPADLERAAATFDRQWENDF